jgi:hypothetical protein
MKKRIGYVSIDLSYVSFITGFCLRNVIGDLTMIFIVSFATLFLIGTYLIASKGSELQTWFDKMTKWISMVPLSILVFIPSLVVSCIELIAEKCRLKKQFNKLTNAGFKVTKSKENKTRAYFFSYNDLVIKFILNKQHDISFDGGKSFRPIIDSGIGSFQEKEHLISIEHLYRTSDYRDSDLYDSTEEYVKFIIKNITLDKDTIK